MIERTASRFTLLVDAAMYAYAGIFQFGLPVLRIH
jgi:hypothetical protein